MTLDRMNDWTLSRLPCLNAAAVAHEIGPVGFIRTMVADVFPLLEPDPYVYTRNQARRVQVLMGLWGSSAVRHYVENGLMPQDDTAPLFSSLTVHGTSFREYLRQVADRVGAGNPARDNYTTLTKWNPPSITATYAGQDWTISSVFTDGKTRTFTGDPAEIELYLFLKKTGVLEQAANSCLEPLIFRDTAPEETIDLLVMAAALVRGIHRSFAAYLRLPPPGRLTPEFFGVHWRQYNAHWDVGDQPPSAAHDADFICRDLMLGLNEPYHRARRAYPAIDADEKHNIARVMHCTPIPNMILERAGVTREQLEAATAAQLAEIAALHPEIAACYLLLAEQTRLATSHMNFSRRFVFDLGRERQKAGLPPLLLQPAESGVSGLTEENMVGLVQSRRAHLLTAFEKIPKSVMASAARPVPPFDLEGGITVSVSREVKASA